MTVRVSAIYSLLLLPIRRPSPSPGAVDMFQPRCWRVGAVTVLSLALLPRGPLSVVSAEQPEPSFRVRAYADRRIAAAILPESVNVAGKLLAAAGIFGSWRLCDGSETCHLLDSQLPEIVVILSNRFDARLPERCGIAAFGAKVFTGTVKVSVPCVQGVVSRLQQQLATKGQPQLAVGRYDDIVGAAIAHELGHLLGLPHASTGLMRSRLEVAEILALRRGALTFSAGEGDAMRFALARTRLLLESPQPTASLAKK